MYKNEYDPCIKKNEYFNNPQILNFLKTIFFKLQGHF